MTVVEIEDARDRPWVSVIGAGSSTPDWVEASEAVGERLAERDAVLVTGGLGGVMEAACRAYKEAGGALSIGVLPGEDRDAANEGVDVPVVTGLGHVRNALVGANADVVVAFAGAGGTMSEIGFARIHGTPVLGMGAWDHTTGVVEVDDVERGLAILDDFLEGDYSGHLGPAGD